MKTISDHPLLIGRLLAGDCERRRRLAARRAFVATLLRGLPVFHPRGTARLGAGEIATTNPELRAS